MSKQQLIDKLKKKMVADKRLPFASTATKLVFGEGSLNPRIYVLGEAPGRLEDESGRPFVGRSGQLLRGLIQSAGIKETDIYITSVVRFRPPKNKTPTPKQVLAYEPYVDAELEIIRPKIIVTVGSVSLRKFTRETITKIHGRPIEIKFNELEFLLVPMFHPAAALRNPHIKKLLIQDFNKIKKLISA